jgi:hypothetical protein
LFIIIKKEETTAIQAHSDLRRAAVEEFYRL